MTLIGQHEYAAGADKDVEIARLRDELSEKDRKYRQDLTELAQVHLRELDKRDEEIERLKKALVSVTIRDWNFRSTCEMFRL